MTHTCYLHVSVRAWYGVSDSAGMPCCLCETLWPRGTACGSVRVPRLEAQVCICPTKVELSLPLPSSVPTLGGEGHLSSDLVYSQCLPGLNLLRFIPGKSPGPRSSSQLPTRAPRGLPSTPSDVR